MRCVVEFLVSESPYGPCWLNLCERWNVVAGLCWYLETGGPLFGGKLGWVCAGSPSEPMPQMTRVARDHILCSLRRGLRGCIYCPSARLCGCRPPSSDREIIVPRRWMEGSSLGVDHCMCHTGREEMAGKSQGVLNGTCEDSLCLVL